MLWGGVQSKNNYAALVDKSRLDKKLCNLEMSCRDCKIQFAGLRDSTLGLFDVKCFSCKARLPRICHQAHLCVAAGSITLGE